jgi:hypothetical protein
MSPPPSRGPGARRSRRNTRQEPSSTSLPEHLRRDEEWNGLRRGDPVDIDGLPIRGATWRFLAFVRNDHNGTESVEVIGGRPGEERIRSFRPDLVFPVGGRRAGRPSLAEAPQLPLS